MCSYEIRWLLKDHREYVLCVQKGHLKVTSKRKSTYKIFVSA